MQQKVILLWDEDGFIQTALSKVLEQNGFADFESSAKTLGAGFYLLKGDLALLNQALIQFAIEHMVKKDYVYIEPPLLLYKDILTAALDMEGFQQSIYNVDQDNLCLIGTSEYSLLGMHADEVIQEHLLPKAGYCKGSRKRRI